MLHKMHMQSNFWNFHVIIVSIIQIHKHDIYMCECVQFNCVFTGAKPLRVRTRAERVIFFSLGLCLCADLPAGSSCKLCVRQPKMCQQRDWVSQISSWRWGDRTKYLVQRASKPKQRKDKFGLCPVCQTGQAGFPMMWLSQRARPHENRPGWFCWLFQV